MPITRQRSIFESISCAVAVPVNGLAVADGAATVPLLPEYGVVAAVPAPVPVAPTAPAMLLLVAPVAPAAPGT